MMLYQVNNETLYKLILKDGTNFDITEDMFSFYSQAYPHLDIHEQFRLMVSWCFSNDAKRKTRRGIKRFINSWLSGAKNKNIHAVQSQRDYVKTTTQYDRLTDDSWAN